ncbi:hypothetical protein SAMN05444274_101210 [Mariniphaga anaerophila]|uniref:Uncharacterized protein n=2 Tax=Mariniphaga anaerophila TaxID=1484053 RepID=A0A1M4T006_9BACT|nr:hypothetical protein SAMN05444274_101210 [Mariniphaga anaerophila]
MQNSNFIRYFLIIAFVFFLQGVIAQPQNEVLQTDVTIRIQKKTFGKLIDEIEQKAKVTFSYNNSTINSDSVISVLIFNGKLEDVLKSILPENTSFTLNSNNIILYRTPSNGQKKAKNKEQPKVLRDAKKEETAINESKKEKKDKPASIPIIQIEPYIFTGLEVPATLNQDTLLQINLAPAQKGLEGNEKRMSSSLRRKNKRTFQSGIFRNNTNYFSFPGRRIVEYSVAPFYQIINESAKYNHFGAGESSAEVKSIITGSEEMLLSSRAGITASVSINQLKFTTGLALQKSNESYNYSSLDTVSSELLFIPDTASFPRVGKNHYQYLSIPLLVGYSGQLTRTISIGGNIGIWGNFLNSRDGYYIDLSSEPPHQIKNLKDAPLNKFKMDVVADISLEYKIFRKTSISFSTSYMHPTGSVFNNEYPVSKSKSAFGYSFALIQKF